MDRFDDAVKKALEQHESQALQGTTLDDPGMFDQVLATFQGRQRWMVVLDFVSILVFGILAVISIVEFSRNEILSTRMAWGFVLVCCILTVAMLKIWYWMELNKNSIIREIKRLELRIVELAERRGPSSPNRP